jgi:two-component system OmpR family response regulator
MENAANSTDALGPARSPIRVLVVESDAHLATVLCWILSHDERFRVVAQARDGQAAVACPADFDVALVDLRISGLGGLGTIARLHERRPCRAIVVLADTDAVYLRHAAAAEGADGYLVKPSDLEKLGDRLADVVKARPAAPELVQR